MKRPRILHVSCECTTWIRASRTPYSRNLGFEDGFEAAGAEYITVPAYRESSSSEKSSWLSRIREITKGHKFDQVWMEIRHGRYDDDFLGWIREVAPIRVGIIWESMETDPMEPENIPEGKRWSEDNEARRLAVLTHLIMVDETDVDRYNVEGKIPAKWLWDAGIVPTRYIGDTYAEPSIYSGLFFGALHGVWGKWLTTPPLNDLVFRPEFSLEFNTCLPELYDAFTAKCVQRISLDQPLPDGFYETYIKSVRNYRRKAYSLWIDTLKQGLAVVNLPGCDRAPVGTVSEGIAAVRPVLNWLHPKWPRMNALFEDGKEILLYARDNPEELAAQIERLHKDPAFGRWIALRGARKMKAHHTVEELVRQVFAWTGVSAATISGPGERKGERVAGTISHKRGGLIFDIGANLGNKSQEFLDGGAGRLVCLEPQPLLSEQLRDRFGNDSRVTIVNKAVADESGIVEMSICSEAPTISTCSPEWQRGRFSEYHWDQTIEVESLTLDDLILQHGTPDYCKIDVEGYELQVLQGLTRCVPMISFEYTREFLGNARACLQHLNRLGFDEFNFVVGESETFQLPEWGSSQDLLDNIAATPDPLLWGDMYARCSGEMAGGVGDDAILNRLKKKKLWAEGLSLRLHLGCGEQHLDGYVNIDHPSSEHNVMNVAADLFVDIKQLAFPPHSVDEIRLHHVFEHFNRVTALALLIRWHSWLKIGGTIYLETPDLLGCAKTLLADSSWKTKSGIVRHIAGDQAAAWAYHMDHWFPERFQHTLSALGFADIKTTSKSWTGEPFLSNVTAIATKARDVTFEEQLAAADALLRESTVSECEQATHDVWKQQLRMVLDRVPNPPSMLPSFADASKNGLVEQILSREAPPLPIEELHNLNQKARDEWVRSRAASTPAGSRVLDIGAGTCPYRPLFSHCEYRTHDFKKYAGVKLGGTREYGAIDYESDITAIPVPDGSFDVILCTEVLEHTPEPIEALREMARILKPGGRLLLTAPLGSGLHQLPYHYYGGFTPEWYKLYCAKFGLGEPAIHPNGGFFRLLAQECARVAWSMPQHKQLHGDNAAYVEQLFGEWIPRYLISLDEHLLIDQFTIGYHVEAVKMPQTAGAGDSGKPCTSLSSAESKSGRVTTREASPVKGLIFSMDRAMQLHALLSSYRLHIRNGEHIQLNVLYRATNEMHRMQYKKLRAEFREVVFHEEQAFRSQVLQLIATDPFVMFMVDDNVFIKPFDVREIAEQLESDPLALGFSLRLGGNTTYCYMADRTQRLPEFRAHTSVLSFEWGTAEYDFGYPLELSSSMYRTSDILPLMQLLDFRNPNMLEFLLDGKKQLFRRHRPRLLCYEESVAFCIPMNTVQTMWENRAGTNVLLTATRLAEEFERGRLIDVARLSGISPDSCHQEVDVRFRVASASQELQEEATPLLSIIILNHNGATHIQTCLDSIRRHTPELHEIIVCDNASADGSREYLRSVPDIVLIENKENIGCPPARAQALALAQGQYVVFLDNDTAVGPHWASRFIEHVKADPKIGVIGPRSNYVSGPQLLPDARYDGVEEMEQYAAARARLHAGERTPAVRLVGFCMFLTRELIHSIGNIDASFGRFGFEDDDYTWRANIAGFRTVIAQDVFVHHTGGPQGNGNVEYNRLLLDAWEVFKSKWGIDKNVPYGAPLNIGQILDRSFDPSRDFIPLPERSTVERLVRHDGSQAGGPGSELAVTVEDKRQALLENVLADLERVEQMFESQKEGNEGMRQYDLAMQLGDCHLKLGHLQESRQYFERALRSNPESAEACFGLGLCFQHGGVEDAARQMFEAAVSLKPDWADAQQRLAECSAVL